MLHFREERMSDELTKHHINALPFDAVIHHFTGKDRGSPHNHPFSFRTYLLKGSYIERIYTINNDGSYQTEVIHRKEGTTHHVKADTIHEIIDLPDGECWTMILPERKVQESGFFLFEEDKISFRSWYENDFKPINL